MTKIFEALQRVPLFSDLPEPVLKDLSDKMTPHHLEDQEILFRQGSVGDSLYIITRGKVRVFMENNIEGELTLILFGPGEFIGEMAMLDQKPRSASVAASGDVDLLELKRNDLLEILSSQPLLAIGMMQSLTSRLRFTSTYLTKSIEWTRKIADGEYTSVIDQIQSVKASITDFSLSDEDKAQKFITSFFKMVEGVQEREELLKEKVHALRIEVDSVKRDRQVSEITETDYFKHLLARVQELKGRQKSADR